ncbi:MAG: hypothetical protein ACLUEQ_05240 [Cloacibacillus evryensis]
MIDNMMLITLFDSLYPCWTREMLVKEGVDMAALERLVEEGLIVPEDGVYSLSETGVAEFRRIALENLIEEKPGEAPADRVRSARAGGFLKLLNAAHLQRWGINNTIPRRRWKYFRRLVTKSCSPLIRTNWPGPT